MDGTHHKLSRLIPINRIICSREEFPKIIPKAFQYIGVERPPKASVVIERRSATRIFSSSPHLTEMKRRLLEPAWVLPLFGMIMVTLGDVSALRWMENGPVTRLDLDDLISVDPDAPVVDNLHVTDFRELVPCRSTHPREILLDPFCWIPRVPWDQRFRNENCLERSGPLMSTRARAL